MYIYIYISPISASFIPSFQYFWEKYTSFHVFFVRPGHDSHSKSLSPQTILECDASVPVEWNIHRMKYTDCIVNISEYIYIYKVINMDCKNHLIIVRNSDIIYWDEK